MYKNNGGINIDKLNEESGDFKNGLEVSAEIQSLNTSEFRDALFLLSMFRNLHVECTVPFLTNIAKIFNERVVVRQGNLLACNILHNNFYKVGNVLYPADHSHLYTSGIIIELPMGQIDITPNREALQYSDITKQTISVAINKVKNTFKDLIQNKVKIASLGDYFNFIEGYSFPIELKNDTKGVLIHIANTDYQNFTFDITIGGEILPHGFATFIRDMAYIYCETDQIYKILSNRRRYRGSVSLRNMCLDNDTIGIKSDNVTKQVTIRYYREQAKSDEDIVIFTKTGIDAYKARIIKQLAIRHRDYDIIKCVDFTFKHLSTIDISNNNVPDSFIKEYKDEIKALRIKPDNNTTFVIRHYDGLGFRNVHYTNFDSLLKYGVATFAVYGANTVEHEMFKDLAQMFSRYKIRVGNRIVYPAVITVKKSDIPYLKNRKKFVYIDDFLYLRNNFLEKLVTAHMIASNFHELNMFSRHRSIRFKEFNVKYGLQITSLTDCSHTDTFKDIFKYYVEKGWYNKVDVEYFKIGDKDVEILDEIAVLNKSDDDLFEAILYKLYGRNRLLNIDKPSSDIYKIIKRL